MTARLVTALIALLLWMNAAIAQSQTVAIAVDPVSGAPAPFDGTLARTTAEALERFGMAATTDAGGERAHRLFGTAETAMTAQGATITVTWTLQLTDGQSTSFSAAETAPYQAEDPWDAIDADTLKRLAEGTARSVEDSLQEAMATGLLPGPEPGLEPDAEPVASTPVAEGAVRVFLGPITGAPGNGNVALASALAQFFAQFDIALIPSPEAGAYVIEGTVTMTATGDREQRVSLHWRLLDHEGREFARVDQENTVPAGSLDKVWGATAVYAAEGAADGLLSALAELGPQPAAAP